jgi:prolyl-tRNA synthetase
MKMSNLFTKTSKTAPADEVSRNAQLLIRAGYVHKEMAGVYAYLPLGLRVLENIKQIVREEMNEIGGQEVLMTTLQPRDIWEKTNRWDDKVVDNWFKTKLKNGTELGVGLTHEEPIVDALAPFVDSYKDLPVYVYQIATKFRNELRAKSGILRGREFLMKDMYSFARTQEEHDELYERAAEAYTRVFERLGIGAQTYRTAADGGYFTTRFSDEYQTISEVGEDTVYVDEAKKIAINEEVLTEENLAKLGLKREDLVEKKSVEVGNIFPLESKYTDALDLYYTDNEGKKQSIIMGCYGIGISRLMGVLAEHFSDEKGLVWPESVAPYRYHMIAIGEEGARVVADLYAGHENEILWDDRDARVGEKLADSELLGVLYRVVISDKSLAAGGAEWTVRATGESQILTLDELRSRLN